MKITKRQLTRIIKEEKSRLIEGQLMYHSTDSKNVGSIQQDGLAVGRESSHTLGGSWADSYYGTRPIYLSVEKGKYAGTPLTVDTSGLALVADLPSLVDTGAYQEEEGMYWDEGSEPAQMIDIVDEDGIVYFDDLLSPGSAASEAAIEITGTAAVLENIPPNRIQLTERRHVKITKRQLKRIIKEERAKLMEQPREDVTALDSLDGDAETIIADIEFAVYDKLGAFSGSARPTGMPLDQLEGLKRAVMSKQSEIMRAIDNAFEDYAQDLARHDRS